MNVRVDAGIFFSSRLSVHLWVYSSFVALCLVLHYHLSAIGCYNKDNVRVHPWDRKKSFGTPRTHTHLCIRCISDCDSGTIYSVFNESEMQQYVYIPYFSLRDSSVNVLDSTWLIWHVDRYWEHTYELNVDIVPNMCSFMLSIEDFRLKELYRWLC